MATYAQLNQRNPEVDLGYWRQLRGLYAGGKKLLQDPRLMTDVFPPHLVEDPVVYQERRKRAYYMPYVGQIIDQIVSGLFSDPLRLEANPQVDEFYTNFLQDCSPPGGRKVSFATFLRATILDALQLKRAWSLAEMPEADPDADSLADEERSGALDAYLCRVPAEAVYDWECDEAGDILWAIVHDEASPRNGVADTRNKITESWTYYTPTEWVKYSITYPKDKPPQDNDPVEVVASGAHSFGKVPLVPLDLSDGFWALDRLAGIAIAHFNKRNALSWAEYKSLFPVLTHFQQAEDPRQPLSEDPSRVAGNKIGQGYVIQAAEKDRLEYVGPDSAPYQTALADLSILRDEMFRIIHHMALSVDNSGAALQRSADSKQVDRAATAVFLRELGHYVRLHAVQLLEMIAAGRKDGNRKWECQGMEKYAEETLDALVGQAEKLELVRIPSPTFQRRYRYVLAKRILGGHATEQDLTDIKDELESNITDEEMEPGAEMEARIEEESRIAKATKPAKDFPEVD